MFKHKPIETVADAQRRAKRKLPRPVYTSILAGNENGSTLRENVDAFGRIGFRPSVGREVAPARDLCTSILGQTINMPIVISPAAAHAIHPEGEVAVARAAAHAGVAIGQSNYAPSRFEDVVDANSQAFFQLYWAGSKDVIEGRVEHVRRAGAKALILTLDATLSQPRDWGTPPRPQRLDLATMVRYAPTALGSPSWLWRFVRHGSLPTFRVPNIQEPDDAIAPTMTDGLLEWMRTPVPTWSDVAWLAELWNGPFMVKGILSPDDARRAVDAGATAIGVSNHGGNNLDTTPSPLRFLPAIVEAVGARAEITFDSGIRRGSDVVKVLALGSQAALIGRSWFYGLAADGERGVAEVLDAYRLSIDRTLIGLGKSSIRELTPDDLVVPEGYFLRSGTDLPMPS